MDPQTLWGLWIITLFLLISNLIFSVLFFRKVGTLSTEQMSVKLESFEKGIEKIEKGVTEQIARNREESSSCASASRQEMNTTIRDLNQSLEQKIENFRTTMEGGGRQLQEDTGKKLDEMRKTVDEKLSSIQNENANKITEIRDEFKSNAKQTREETTTAIKEIREGTADSIKQMKEETTTAIKEMKEGTTDSIKQMKEETTTAIKEMKSEIYIAIKELNQSVEQKIENFRTTMEREVRQLQEDTGKKLDEIRKTVDEKLHDTLDRRLGESFKQVSDRLELVSLGLGEMKSLAEGVGDLKKVLSNVKTRGTWGEVQLGNLLEQVLTPEQFEKNVATGPVSGERVEYAIKLPGGQEGERAVWLPIDAKFPQEQYIRITESAEKGDPTAVAGAIKQLETAIKKNAGDIFSKYVNPPNTTDFAIMFLPTEGLYAEVLRIPGLVESLQRDYRIVIAGPTTLWAILNSLQMGFRTLSIQKRSSEVWNLLSAVKTEFSKFGDIMEKVGRKIQQAGDEIGRASVRTRAIERKLREVQELPPEKAEKLLNLPSERDARLDHEIESGTFVNR